MSIIFNGRRYCLLDHRAYLSSLYKEVLDESSRVTPYEINEKLFCIKTKQISKGNRKRKYNNELQAEAIKVKELYNNFFDVIPGDLKEIKLNKNHLVDTKEVRQLSQELFEATSFDFNGISGGNIFEKPLKCMIKQDNFLVPQNSRFLCGNIQDQCQKLDGNKYDILIADPPWWNKYIRRLKNANDKLSYSMMYNEDIAAIPVQHLLATNCLVAVWCTNASSNIEAVKNLIFPKWGVEYVTTWYWLKVTIDYEPLCPFSAGCKKQPYERIIIGKVGQIKEIPEEKLVVSVPSAFHSHKPPLIDILKPYLDNASPAILELFARYLLPNTTSVGFEPLKWQHISLFEKIPNKDNVT